jgi:5-methylcytosine-specific restriction endonuclease McrA
MIREHKSALVLNADMMPLSRKSWKVALDLWFKDKVDIVTFYHDDCIRGINKEFPVPAVIRVRKYVKRRNRVKYSKENILIRDRLRCQYCNYKFRGPEDEDITLDHVLPRSQWNRKDIKGTPTKWSNIVTACRDCNLKKGSLTPSEAKMPLLNKPKEPYSGDFIYNLKPWNPIEKEWEPYLSYTRIYKKMIEEQNETKV